MKLIHQKNQIPGSKAQPQIADKFKLSSIYNFLKRKNLRRMFFFKILKQPNQQQTKLQIKVQKKLNLHQRSALLILRSQIQNS